ncbi:MAG: site-specific DNA-methyltransferase [Treponema sp.]|nr:site-specific DNA-methyltransferase [Treponema sp.]
MSFCIQWTDFCEIYDRDEEMAKVFLEPRPCEDCHLFIEGDNYPVLKLLSEDYRQKVDLIYIDPPYNTGNCFTYNDSFGSREDKHSAWLSFMDRRLRLARELLCESGCIFIAIDQSELYVLKLLCDGIFGEENFVNDFMWLHGKGKKDSWSRTLQQHTLCFAKNKKNLGSFVETEYSAWAKNNVDGDVRGNWFSGSISFSEKRSNPRHKNYFSIRSPSGVEWTRQWQVSWEEMQELLADNKIYFGNAPEYDRVPRVKIFNDEVKEVIPKNIIDCVDSTRKAQRHLDDLLGEDGVFDNPKPVELISHLIEITAMKKDAVIMDFFAGSGTTFEAVMDLNKRDGGARKCILIQKNEAVNEKKKKAGLGFESISDICKARIEKVKGEERVLYCCLKEVGKSCLDEKSK